MSLVLSLQRQYYDEDHYESELRYHESVDELLNRPFGEVISDFFLGLFLLALIVLGYVFFRDKIKSKRLFKWLYAFYALTLSVFFFKYFGIFLEIFIKNILLIGFLVGYVYYEREVILKYIKEVILKIKEEDKGK